MTMETKKIISWFWKGRCLLSLCLQLNKEQTQKHTHTQTHTQTQTRTHTHKQTHKHTHRNTHTQSHLQREKKCDCGRGESAVSAWCLKTNDTRIRQTLKLSLTPDLIKQIRKRKGNQGSISPTFYKQLVCSQIPKAKKRQSSQAAFCTFGICLRKSCL